VLFIFYYFADGLVGAVFDPQSTVGGFIRQSTGFSERAIERVGLMVRTGIDLVFLVAGIPLLVIIWTLTWVDFGSLFNTLALGVQVGNLRISPATVLTVLAILVFGIVTTKLFNRWLDRRILSETHIDKGVQDSILKGASYSGYILAAGFALTAGGLNFSNLAIIAGALGVGIGFGLQAIVNNFVSGLIILAERPIRVGDWVALPDGEGVVRRINVRSTEIETFDACTIIIPNLSLVTGPVRNWTHSDNIGRVVVSLTVEVGSDAELVQKLLVEAARSHPRVLTAPAASVLLTELGLNGLEFSLRVFVSDIMDGSQIASELRFAILRSFGENGVNISQPVGLFQAPK
jgi:small-conductance mechanosensitive channel